MSDRVFRDVTLEFRLAGPHGVTPTTQSKRWFFELPTSRDSDDGWTELLNRIFYDANVMMRRREPADPNWLTLDSYTVEPVDLPLVLSWPGTTDRESTEKYLPWFISCGQIVWEPGACYFVDDDGRYDDLDGNDYCELIAVRAEAAGVCDLDGMRDFLARVYPGDAAGVVFSDRENRLRNVAVVRPSPRYRKPVDTKPWVSGPPRLS